MKLQIPHTRALLTYCILCLSISLSFVFSFCTEDPVESSESQIDISPPTGVIATTIPPNKVRISWTAKQHASTQYSIERKIGVTGTYNVLGGGYSSISSFVDSLAVVDSAYYYRIRMKGPAGYGGYSEEVGIQINLLPPANLTVTANNEVNVGLSWTSNTVDHNGFLVERKGDNGQFINAASVDSNETTWADTAYLEGSVGYTYRVKTFWRDERGGIVTSSQSNEVTITPVFLPPSNLTVSVTAETSAVIQWTDNTTSETKFIVEHKQNSQFVLLDSVPENTVSYTHRKLFLTNTPYSYRVRAASGRRRSVYSNTDSSSIAFPSPSGFQASLVAEKGIQLQWQDNSAFESGFQLERREGNSGTFVQIDTTLPANTTSFFDSVTAKTDSVMYVYRIRAVSVKGNVTSYSPVDSTRFVFQGPSSVAFSFIDATSLQVQWQNNSTSEEGIKIEQTVLATGKKDSVTLSPGTTSQTYLGLNDLSMYQYRVKAFRGKQESRYSPFVRAFRTTSDITPVRTITDTTEILAVCADTNGAVIATGGMSGVIRLWNTATGAEIGALVPDVFATVRGLSINAQNTRLAAAYDDGTIRVWNLSTLAIVWKKNSGSGANAVMWNSTGTGLASAHADHAVRIWNGADGSVIRTITGHQSSVQTVHYSNSGITLATGSADQSVKLWSTSSWAELKSIGSSHTGTVNGVAVVFPGDSLTASAGSDGLVRIWQNSSGNNAATLSGHFGSATSIVSPGYLSLVSTGSNKSIRLWNLSDWSLVKNIPAHTATVTSSAVSRNRKILVTGSLDKTVSVWNLVSQWAQYSK